MNNLEFEEKDPSIIIRFFHYLKSPFLPIQVQRFHSSQILSISFLYFVVFFAGILLISPFVSIIGMDEMPHKLEEVFQQLSGWQAFVIVVLITPFIEEFIFRFPLAFRKTSFLLVSIFLCLLGFLIVFNITGNSFLAGGVSGVLLIAALFSIIFRNTIFSEFEGFDRWVEAIFPWIFYLTAAFFAFMHVFNFQGGSFRWFYIPIMVMPQFLLGLVLGYTRLRFGMWSNIYLHALNNLFPMLFLLFGSDSFFG